MWSFTSGHSYLPHDLVLGFSALWPSLPFPALLWNLISYAADSPPLSHSNQHPEAKKQTSITCRPQEPALVPPGACSSRQDPHRQEDTSYWYQDQTQTSPDTRQGPVSDSHCSCCGNRPRIPTARDPRGEKEWVWLPWRQYPSFKVTSRFLADIRVALWTCMITAECVFHLQPLTGAMLCCQPDSCQKTATETKLLIILWFIIPKVSDNSSACHLLNQSDLELYFTLYWITVQEDLWLWSWTWCGRDHQVYFYYCVPWN